MPSEAAAHKVFPGAVSSRMGFYPHPNLLTLGVPVWESTPRQRRLLQPILPSSRTLQSAQSASLTPRIPARSPRGGVFSPSDAGLLPLSGLLPVALQQPQAYLRRKDLHTAPGRRRPHKPAAVATTESKVNPALPAPHFPSSHKPMKPSLISPSQQLFRDGSMRHSRWLTDMGAMSPTAAVCAEEKTRMGTWGNWVINRGQRGAVAC